MPKKDQNENAEVAAPAEQPERSAIETILLINALLTLLEQFIGRLNLGGDGKVTVEEQQAIRARYDALAADMDAAFGGDHWKVRPNPIDIEEHPVTGAHIKKSAKPTDGADT